jgi:small subunit ribosomal protein S1
MSQSRENAEATSFAEAMENLDLKTPQQGELLRGTIVSISGDDAYISYGGPSEAVMDTAELEGLDIGDHVEATVVKTGGEMRVSRKLIKGKASLDQLRTAYENRLPVEGKVTGRNKGGFEVNISGLRAFCPLSQIALGKIENPDTFVNQTIEFRVTELSDDGRRIVVSRAALLKEAAAERAAETRNRIVPGAELTGRIKTLTPFGAFVDLGGIDGLLHVSEMSRRRVTDPKDLVQIGQEVHVKVIKIENDGKRISLSMKDQEPDPWSDVADRYTPGTQFAGRIVRSTDFGYFVEVEPGVDGLVHVSQLPHGIKPGDAEVAIGTTVQGWVREVDSSKKRLSLSLRAVAVRSVGDRHAALLDRQGRRRHRRSRRRSGHLRRARAGPDRTHPELRDQRARRHRSDRSAPRRREAARAHHEHRPAAQAHLAQPRSGESRGRARGVHEVHGRAQRRSVERIGHGPRVPQGDGIEEKVSSRSRGCPKTPAFGPAFFVVGCRLSVSFGMNGD